MSSIANSCHARLKELLSVYGGKLRALIESHRLSRHGIDADDVEQEVRIRLWRALERDRNSVFHASYIQRVVLSVVIDAVRHAKVRVTEVLPEDDETMALPMEGAGPERLASEGQQVHLVTRCLDELPASRRAALQLHLQGFSLEEIGVLTGVTAEAARKLVSRGLARLKQRLAELGSGEFDE